MERVWQRQKADHRFTLLIAGRQELVVIADWRAPCWKAEPVYTDGWASVLWFTAPEHPEPWPAERIVHDTQQALF